MEELKIKAGKSYNIVTPRNQCKPSKVHIDYILNNPKGSNWDDKLIIFRTWNRKRWIFYCYEYWILAIYNEWEWNKKKEIKLWKN